MRNPVKGAQFRRDVKLAQRRGKDMAKLREVILLLIEGGPLPPRYTDHPLSGDWKHFRDCHLEPDWLLIYKVDRDHLYCPHRNAFGSVLKGLLLCVRCAGHQRPYLDARRIVSSVS